MKVYVLGSNHFVHQMVESKNKLCELGFEGSIHPHYEEYVRGEREDKSDSINKGEAADIKRENNYLKVHYKHICDSDAILIVNLEKKGVKNYIGGNCLIEMGQAYVHDKIIYLLTEIPQDSAYRAEIEAMDPICLHGDLNNIKKD